MSTIILPHVLPCSVSGVKAHWLVLHGWGQEAAYWRPVARHLAGSGIALLCPDMRSLAANSPAPQGSASRLRQLADHLASAVSASGVSAIVAHSAGAPVGVLLAERVNLPLVLMEPMPYQLGLTNQPNTNLLRAPTYDGPLFDQLKRLYPFAHPGTLRIIAAAVTDEPPPSERLHNETNLSRGTLVRDTLAKLRETVLVIRGGRSALLNSKDTDSIAAAIPRATVVVLPNAGHSAHIDVPRELTWILTDVIPKIQTTLIKEGLQ